MDVDQRDTSDPVVPVDLLHFGVPDGLDLGMLGDPVAHDHRSAELIAPMDDGDLRCELRQEESFLHGGVAAADHHQLPVPEEEAITGGTRRDAASGQPFLSRNAQPLGGSPGADDDRPRQVLIGTDPDPFGISREVDPGDVRGHETSSETLGLLAEVIHQLGAENSIGKSRVVLDVGGDHQLTPGLDALEDEWFQVGPSRRRELR